MDGLESDCWWKHLILDTKVRIHSRFHFLFDYLYSFCIFHFLQIRELPLLSPESGSGDHSIVEEDEEELKEEDEEELEQSEEEKEDPPVSAKRTAEFCFTRSNRKLVVGDGMTSPELSVIGDRRPQD